MKANELEKTLRQGEWFHNLTVPQGMWSILRVDGRSFTKLTSRLGLERPFDEKFSIWMEKTAAALLEEFQGIYAYTQSDEISVVLPKNFDLFNRSLEKLVSISASIASTKFTSLVNTEAQFDSRIWMGVSPVDVVDYMGWRQADAARNALNSWCYWTLKKSGLSGRAADKSLKGVSQSYKHDLLMNNGINFNDLPAWQRRGIGLWWVEYEKEGFNPITNETVKTTRKKIKVKRNLSMKEPYRSVVWDILDGLYFDD